MGSDVTGFHNQLSLKVIKGPRSFIITALSLKKSLFCCCLNSELHLDPEEISILLLSLLIAV